MYRNRNAEKRLMPAIALGGLWILNLMIVIFGAPFLVVNGIREYCREVHARRSLDPAAKSWNFPCGSGSS